MRDLGYKVAQVKFHFVQSHETTCISQILDDTVGEFELNIGRFGSMYLVVMPIYFFKRCPSMTVNVNQIVPIIIMSLFYFGK